LVIILLVGVFECGDDDWDCRTIVDGGRSSPTTDDDDDDDDDGGDAGDIGGEKA